MSLHETTAARKIILTLALLLPSGLSSQTPAAPGRLQIDSAPTGANIIMNGNAVSQKTPVILVVSPGTYTVSVVGDSGKGAPSGNPNPNCQKQSVTVQSGETVAGYCSGTSWTVKSD